MNTQQKDQANHDTCRFFENEQGNSALEYAVMLGVIGVTLLPVVQTLGQTVSGIARGIADVLASAPETVPVSGSFNPAPDDPSSQ